MRAILGFLGGIQWQIIAIVGVGIWGLYGHWKAQEAKLSLANHIAASNAAAIIAGNEQRRIEQLRHQALQEVTRAQSLLRAREADAARSDAAAAADAERRLRDAVASHRAAGSSAGHDTGIASNGAPAAAYEQLFLACTAEYRELAADATSDLVAARGAGTECEQSYDAATLTKKP